MLCYCCDKPRGVSTKYAFCSVIENEHPVEFRKFLLEIESGTTSKPAFAKAFETDTATQWKEFKVLLKNLLKAAGIQ